MKDYSKQTIGEIIESLIYIKDNCYIGTRERLEALNNACNILSRRFNRSNPADILINEYITSIHWQEEDIRQALAEEGYEPSEENVVTVLNQNIGLEKYLQEAGIVSGWEVVNNAIEECKGKLRPIILSKED